MVIGGTPADVSTAPAAVDRRGTAPLFSSSNSVEIVSSAANSYNNTSVLPSYTTTHFTVVMCSIFSPFSTIRVDIAMLSYPTTGFSPPAASARTLLSVTMPLAFVLSISWNDRAGWFFASS